MYPKVLRVDGYWDGPLAGKCEYRGQGCSFKTYFIGGWYATDYFGIEDKNLDFYAERIYSIFDETGRQIHAAPESEMEYIYENI